MRLRFQRNHPGSKRGEGDRAIAQVSTDIEDEITGSDERSIELPQATLASRPTVHS